MSAQELQELYEPFEDFVEEWNEAYIAGLEKELNDE